MKRAGMRWFSRVGFVFLLAGWLAVWSEYTTVTAVVETRPAALALFVAATALLASGAIRSRSRSSGIGASLAAAGIVASIYLLQFAYVEEEVRFQNGDLTLSGTLYAPRGEIARAGVVFIHGSGKSTGKFFRWFAKHFARHGIASLIYHKRGSGQSEGDLLDATYHDYASDAAAAVRWMQGRRESIPSGRVGLFGHSEGGWVAPITASILKRAAMSTAAVSHSVSSRERVAFVIVSSTTTMTAARQVLYETRAEVRSAGYGSEIANQAHSLQQRVLDVQRTGKHDPELQSDLERARESPWFGPAGLPVNLHQPEDYRWWRSVMDIDVGHHWTKVDVPVLALSGGLDRHSDVRSSQTAIEELLRASGNEHFTGRIYPNADHALVEWWLPGRIPPPRYPSGLGDFLVGWIDSAIAVPPSAVTTAFDPFVRHLDEAVPALLSEANVSGAAVGLVSDGVIVHLRGYGFADRERAVPMTPDTILNVASVSKTATAWGAMRLVESGEVGLDQPVSDYLHRWRIPDSEWDETEVTLRRLMSHTAGISLPAVPEYEPLRLPSSLEEALRGVDGVRLLGQPGLSFGYSGGGYMIVQLLIEEITGESFAEWMRNHLFLELGMTSTTFEPTAEQARRRALPYDAGKPIEALEYKGLAAAGMYSTARDLAVFASHWLASAQRGGGVLHPETVAEMMRPQPAALQAWGLRYGLGYDLWPVAGIEEEVWTAGHRGQNTGWSSVVWSNPSRGDALVVLTNDSDGSDVHRWLLCDWIAWSSEGGSFGGYCSGRQELPRPWRPH